MYLDVKIVRSSGDPVIFDTGFPGMRRFYSEDPHGNRLEFLEPVNGSRSAQRHN